MAQIETPVRPLRRVVIEDSGDPGYNNRIMIGTAVTGLVRVEWHQAVMAQIIPVNWGQVSYQQGIPQYMPLRYEVADAQNLIVKKAIEDFDFEWLLLWEHDVLPPPDSYIRLNKYMRDEKVPIVSGLYWSRGHPTDPLVFRGRGVGAYYDWEPGDQVWCDGVPTGFLLIHAGILREMWKDSEEYEIPYGVQRVTTRRIFTTPRDIWQNPETGDYNTMSGTSDLDWCTRIMEDGYFAKAGWHEYQDKEFPFLVDTSIACGHINPDGEVFP